MVLGKTIVQNIKAFILFLCRGVWSYDSLPNDADGKYQYMSLKVCGVIFLGYLQNELKIFLKIYMYDIDIFQLFANRQVLVI